MALCFSASYESKHDRRVSMIAGLFRSAGRRRIWDACSSFPSASCLPHHGIGLNPQPGGEEDWLGSGRGPMSDVCIVVDSGFSFTHVIPFHQGRALHKSVRFDASSDPVLR